MNQLNVQQNAYIYPISFPLERSHLRALSRMEIDKIGIQWSSGYEEYTVYELDFFIKQIECLRQTTPKQN